MMRLILLFLITLILQFYNPLIGQQKKPVDFILYDYWKEIRRTSISDDGKWVTYEVNPYKGDGELVIMNPDRLIKKTVKRAAYAQVSPKSDYVAFKIMPQTKLIRSLKKKKAKKDEMPKDSLGIYVFDNEKYLLVSDLVSFKVAENKSNWMVYLHTYDETKESGKSEEAEKAKAKKRVKGAPAVFDLVILNPVSSKEYRFKEVSEYTMSENGKLISFVQVEADSIIKSKVSVFDTEEEDIQKVFYEEGIAKKITVDFHGRQTAFLFSNNNELKKYSLYYWKEGEILSSELVLDDESFKIPKDWIVSINGGIWFSRNGTKLYFGTALKPEAAPKDTLLDEEKVVLDVWSWTDPLIQAQQLNELRKEKKRTYLTVFDTKSKEINRLADLNVPEVKTVDFGNSDFALGISDKDFQKEQSWLFPSHKDYYLIDVKTGDKKIVLAKTNADAELSPFGKYLYWFDKEKRAWFVRSTKSDKVLNLTSSLAVNFYDEEYDYPAAVPAYGATGWTKDDRYLLVYDKFDIWKLDPNGIEPPVNMTKGIGRENSLQFTYLKLNKDINYLEQGSDILLRAFNDANKQSGFYRLSWNSGSSVSKIFMDDFDFRTPIKAKNAEKIVWQKSSVNEYPDVWYSGSRYEDVVKISNVNSQQKNYNWATAELVKWTAFDGRKEEGLLYKPENFDPSKKYPMIVFFYRLNSDKLHVHYYPKPSRSTMNVLFYASHGYLVFIPNIRYEKGYPGKSAYNYVVSGTKAMIAKGFVDEQKVGIHGQSWGGYQATYIITKTDLFKAASVGAPVANMTSAYGGIRWLKGESRMSQYENGQSRLGATIWENPELYFKNSPLFYADRIKTPLLIRHNDKDGAVPWSQSVEMFLALRRLDKPVWLLNYNGQGHNLKSKSPACKDYSKRMFQFYEHYLRGKPAPVWMTKGIPAIKKGETLGYEYSE